MLVLPIIKQAETHRSLTAIREGDRSFPYSELLQASRQWATQLLYGSHDLSEARVAYMVTPGFDYVKTQWAIWLAGGVAVPLFLDAPAVSIQYSLDYTGAKIMVVSPEYLLRVKPLCYERGIRILLANEIHNEIGQLPEIEISRKAMILFTSGTTNLPKGVVSTHANIQAQITSLVKAWEWSHRDHVLCVLPLHHVHGIINVVGCSLWAGAACEFIPTFSASDVFRIFNRGQVNVFMAVPTIYFKLIAHWESLSEEHKKNITEVLTKFRLMVSGSAALPVSVMEKWKAISNHTLLERYGMTEIGMALSNPYLGKRKPGYVGAPLPGVDVRLCDEQDKVVEGIQGEIQVKGATVFREYWQQKEATEKSFTPDGWFKTGDVAELDEHGYYKILGRNSQDIIKSGGYKISAIEIEEVLREYKGVSDCSVVGVPDEEWGEQVAVVVVVENEIDRSELDAWLKEKLSKYKVPRLFEFVQELPRNAMGKVKKNELKQLFKAK